MHLTSSQRFDTQFVAGKPYAPLSHGCPSMTMAVDYRTFKKSDEEKGLLATLKAKLVKPRNHKFVTFLHASF
jgi:hypothetical protein